MNRSKIRLNTIPTGICLGAIIGFAGGQYLLRFEQSSRITQSEKTVALKAEEISRRLFPEMSLLDIYKDQKIIDILRNPNSVAVYSRNPMSRGTMMESFEVGGFEYYYKEKALSRDDETALSVCFRSINSLEVGYGYPCTFDPTYLIRFVSKSGSDTVDFSFGTNCYIVEWYFNGKLIGESISRLKMNAAGVSILDAALNSE